MIEEDKEPEDAWPIITIEPRDLEQWWTPDPKGLADLKSNMWVGRNMIIAGAEEADPASLAEKLAFAVRSRTRRSVAFGHAWQALRDAKEHGAHRLPEPDVLVLTEITDLPQPLFDVLLDVLQQRVGRSTVLVGESEPTIRGFFAEDLQFKSALAPFLANGRCLVVRARSETDGARV